jgi:hypothetical protein
MSLSHDIPAKLCRKRHKRRFFPLRVREVPNISSWILSNFIHPAVIKEDGKLFGTLDDGDNTYPSQEASKRAFPWRGGMGGGRRPASCFHGAWSSAGVFQPTLQPALSANSEFRGGRGSCGLEGQRGWLERKPKILLSTAL